MFTALATALVIVPATMSELSKEPLPLKGSFTVDGKPGVVETKGSKATVLMFLAHDCPIANRYAPEIGRITKEYGKKKVKFYRVYINEVEEAGLIKTHAYEYMLEFPALLDPNFALVRETGVRVTPEVVVLNEERQMMYRGRIDNQNIEHGKIREGYRRDLRIALDEVLAGKPVSEPTTAAVGCFIPDF